MTAKKNSGLTWQDPPTHRRGSPYASNAKYQEEAAELKAHPNQWALLETQPAARTPAMRNKASWISAGRAVAFRHTEEGTFKAVSRLTDDETVGLYVQYIPALTKKEQ